MHEFQIALTLVLEEGEGYLVECPEGPEFQVGQRFEYRPEEVPSIEDILRVEKRGPNVAELVALKEHEETRGTWYVEEVCWSLVAGVWEQGVTLTRDAPRGG